MWARPSVKDWKNDSSSLWLSTITINICHYRICVILSLKNFKHNTSIDFFFNFTHWSVWLIPVQICAKWHQQQQNWFSVLVLQFSSSVYVPSLPAPHIWWTPSSVSTSRVGVSWIWFGYTPGVAPLVCEELWEMQDKHCWDIWGANIWFCPTRAKWN